MGFIVSPDQISSMMGTAGQYNAGPSQSWIQRLMGSMGGPQPVGGPTGMQRLGGALGSAMAAPMMAKQPDMGFGGVPSQIGAAGGMMRPDVMPRTMGPMIGPGGPMGQSNQGGPFGSGIFNRFRKMQGQPQDNSSGSSAGY